MNHELVKAIIYLLVGVAILLIGMRMMSAGFRKSIGKRIRGFFKRTQDKAWLNLGIGTAVTAAIQSSDATNAMVVGFINTGAMSVYQGLCIMLGAYIGTTVTGVIASFSSLSISIYFLLLVFIGTVMMVFFQKDMVNNIGEILAGLGLLFLGLALMKDSFKNPDITNFTKGLFSSINFGPLLFLIGVLVTAIMDSSSAVTSIVIAMVGSGAIELSSGLFIVLGATLGTVVTTLIVAIGGHVNGKRAAWIAFSLRTLSSVVMVLLLTIFRTPITTGLSTFAAATSPELAVAIFTVVYNVIFMPALLPLVKPSIKLFERIIKEKPSSAMDGVLKHIEDKMLAFPHIATAQVEKEIINMYLLAFANYRRSVAMILTKNFEEAPTLLEVEDQVDYLNEKITTFLIKLSSKEQPESERKAGSFFHVVNDIERIADHAVNIYLMAKELEEKELAFSELAKSEIESLNDIILQMFTLTKTIIEKSDYASLVTLHGLEEQADSYKSRYFNNHYERIKNKSCVFELSPFYSSLLTDLERISDHINNIGFSIVNPIGVDEYD
ncbi:MAG: Na/Pi cotransporter family protein [Bacilli bacterium]|jgi:phosphate:Na+ symporter